ncbi:MAG: hypothetical protein L0H93_18895, partial [Nocardioides sp.]|nr:hypothetical protein [Nocardioides sp.]
TRGYYYTPAVAERRAAMPGTGIGAEKLLRCGAASGPLPDEHAAAALWWRMARHLTPAVAAQISDLHHDTHLTADWASRLAEIIGTECAERVQASNWWPALVSNIDHGLAAGWRLEDLLAGNPLNDGDGTGDVDECQALVWRTSIALVPIPDEQTDDYWFDPPPDDLWDDNLPPLDEAIDPDWINADPVAAEADIDPDAVDTVAAAWDDVHDEDQYIEGGRPGRRRAGSLHIPRRAARAH